MREEKGGGEWGRGKGRRERGCCRCSDRRTSLTPSGAMFNETWRLMARAHAGCCVRAAQSASPHHQEQFDTGAESHFDRDSHLHHSRLRGIIKRRGGGGGGVGRGWGGFGVVRKGQVFNLVERGGGGGALVVRFSVLLGGGALMVRFSV